MTEGNDVACKPRTYSMAGHRDFGDVVHYIEKITYDIWNRKLVGLIDRYYRSSTTIHTNNGDVVGAEAVIANTVARLAAFPDFHGVIEDTIWMGNDQDGYSTSMRWVWTGCNTGHSVYGPPTGCRARVRAIANCLVKGDIITEEWLTTDELGLVRQLGLDPQHVVTQQLGRQQLMTTSAPRQAIPAAEPHPTARDNGYVASGFDVQDFVRTTFHEVWNRRMFGRMVDRYAQSYVAHTVDGRELYGTDELMHGVLVLLAAFPDAILDIDDVFWLDDGNGRVRTAVRWTLCGTHAGPGPWGNPTGRHVQLMGISHHRIERDQFVEGWTSYGALDLLRQLRPDAERILSLQDEK